MFDTAIDSQTKQTLGRLKEGDLLANFYLAGGTALALHLGHRISVDLDFFCSGVFLNDQLLNKLQKYQPTVTQSTEGTIEVRIDATKTSFFLYNYPLLEPLTPYENIKIASVADIACMKIAAISQRGAKKDFFDLYFLLKQKPLSEILALFEKKFEKTPYEKLHILKSLVYFADADRDPEPHYLIPTSWEEIKNKITSEVLNVS